VLTRGPGDAQPAQGKHVPSIVPGAGPRDASGDLARHRDRTDAGPTVPPGGYPETVGGNPGAPADRQVSGEPDTGVATSGPGPYSTAAAGMAHTSRAAC
jgi:hypothetical protein